VVSGGTTLNLVGVPTQNDPATGAVTRDATMLYVNGNITSLSGPGQGVPAVQDGTALTITAAGNVTVTGDILYNKEPVTTTQNQIPGSPADTLIPGNNSGQVLGIFTGSGDIQLKNGQSNGNLEIDASLATISNNGTGGLINVSSQINIRFRSSAGAFRIRSKTSELQREMYFSTGDLRRTSLRHPGFHPPRCKRARQIPRR